MKLFVLYFITMMLVVDCGAGALNTASDVTEALDEHTVEECSKNDFEMIGGDSGLTCRVRTGTQYFNFIEIYTFDGNAKEACKSNEFCEPIVDAPMALESIGASLRFHDNVMILLHGDNHADLVESLISDLQNG